MSRLGVWVRKLFDLLWTVVQTLWRLPDSQSITASDDDLKSFSWLHDERIGHTGGISVNIVILTPIRMFGDGLAACFSSRSEISGVAIVNDLARLRDTLETNETQVVLIDVTQGIDLFDVRAIASQFPDVPLLALGLNEQRQEVISCGRKGFAGYIPRDASIDVVCKSLSDVAAGRLTCPPEISCGLLRALFRKESSPEACSADLALTRRES